MLPGQSQGIGSTINLLVGILSLVDDMLLSELTSETSEPRRWAILKAVSYGASGLKVTKELQDLKWPSQRYPFDIAGVVEQLRPVRLTYACWQCDGCKNRDRSKDRQRTEDGNAAMVLIF